MTEDTHKQINFKIGKFSPITLIAKNIIPLLDSMGWKGANTDLLEALCDNPNEMDLEGLLKTMASLRFEGQNMGAMRRGGIQKKLPFLCISRGNVLTVISKSENGYQVFDGNTGKYAYRKRLPYFRQIICFSSLDSYRFSLLNPQKKWFTQVLQRFVKEWFLLIAISLLITVVSFLTPLMIMMIYSQIQSAEDTRILIYLGAAVLAFVLTVNGLKLFRSFLLCDVAGRIGNIISNEVFRRLLYLPPQYTEIASVQQQTNRLRDFETIKGFFAGTALTSFIDAPLSLLLLIGLYIISGPVALVPTVSIALFSLFSFYYYRNYKTLSARGLASSNMKNLVQNEMISYPSLIRSSGYSSVWFEKFRKLCSESLNHSTKNAVYLQRIHAIAKGITSLTLITTICFSVFLVIDGKMNGGALFAAFLLTGRIMSPVATGLSVFSQYSRYQNSVDQLNRLMSLSIEQRPQTLIKVHKQLDGTIRFKNVFLKYSKDFAPALMNLSFSIKAGDILGVIGHEGSGKSSILKLLMAMYTPMSGSILIDNINMKQIDVIRLRKSISYIPSRSYTFSGSIIDNLYLVRPDSSESEIDQALESVGLDQIIHKLPYGIHTSITEFTSGGSNIFYSKLINLAQALLRDAPLLLIDEPERGLSTLQIEEMITIMTKVLSGKTALMVSSNEEILQLTTHSLIIDNGRIVNSGSSYDILQQYFSQDIKGGV